MYTIQRREDGRWFAAKYQKLKDRAVRRCVSSEYRVVLCIFTQKNTSLILILPSASADTSAAKYSVGWRVTFKVVDTLTVRPQMAGRPFQEQPHELYRK